MAEADTPWQAGRLDGRRGPRAVLFGRTYEDPRIELRAFEGAQRVMCIASAGCTPRALAAQHQVVAVDINPVQLEYARHRLSGGAPQAGKAERLMAAVRSLSPLVGVPGDELRAFVDMDDPERQAEVFARLCTRRVRLCMDVLFSFGALRSVYASPLLKLLPPRFGRVLLQRFARGFATHPNRDNPFARALLLGELSNAITPVDDDAVQLVCDDAAGYLESQPAGSFDGVSLSNILDGASDGYRQRLFSALRHAVGPGGQVVLRSFGAPLEEREARLASDDRSMLWGRVWVGQADALR